MAAGSALLLAAACGSDDSSDGTGGAGAASGAAGTDSGTGAAAGAAGSGGVGGSAGAPLDGGNDADAGPQCGNGNPEADEECDLGTSNGPGTGCETDCTFSCHASSECSDGEPCNGDEACSADGGGQRCTSGTALADDASCGTGGYCKAQVCTQPNCGDGITEPGETCDPPNGTTCTNQCVYVECGDGLVTGDEQCDDGNLVRWDGCDSTCHYEVVQRAIDIGVPNLDAPSYCVHRGNVFGKAFSADQVREQLADSIKAAQRGGAGNLMFAIPGLDDLTGTNDADIEVGILGADLDPRRASTWTPSAIDWWFVGRPTGIDSSDNLLHVLSGGITSSVLLVGPNRVDLHVVSGTTPSIFDSRDTMFRAKVLDTPAPDVPAPPPSALGAGLVVFQEMDAMGSDMGLCGALTVQSLADIQIPSDFQFDGRVSCQANSECGPADQENFTRRYDATNTMLDLVVGGCRVLCSPAVVPTDPDVGVNGNAPNALEADKTTGKVTVIEPDDAFSFWVNLATNRAHITNNLQ